MNTLAIRRLWLQRHDSKDKREALRYAIKIDKRIRNAFRAG